MDAGCRQKEEDERAGAKQTIPHWSHDWKKRKDSTRSGMVRVFLYVQVRRGELLRLVGKVVGGLHLNETLLSCELVLSVKG